MTDHHHHGTDRGIHPGLPPPPPNLPRMLRAAGPRPEGDPPHFWPGGPVTHIKLPKPRRVRARDGTVLTVGYEVRWWLDRVEGTSRQEAVKRLYDVLLRPDGWLQSGVHWKRVARRADATIIVRVIPADTTVCGAGSAGCFSWGYEPDRIPVAEMGVEYIDRDGPWNVITGMELCGHPLSMHDMYTPQHQPYLGSMGTWESAAKVGYTPTPAEIQGTRQWLAGLLPAAQVHDH